MPYSTDVEDHLLNIQINPDTGATKVPLPPKQSRLTSSRAADQLFYEAWLADRLSAYDRARVQAMVDGEAPYDEEELKNLGQGQRCNLNFLEGEAKVEEALMAYNDLTSSVDCLVSVVTDYGEPSQREPWQEIIAKEFDAMLRRWARFEYNIQVLARHYVTYGLGVSFFEDDRDWRWKVCGLGDFLLPRNTPANEEDIDYVMVRRRYTTTELYRFITDPKTAEEVGWNVKETREAIKRASTQKNKPPSALEWEELEREIKNNDIFFGRCRSKEVYVVHFWVREFDGSISHFITCEDNQGEDFLYKKLGCFETMHHCLNVFTYGIGNDYYHSIRGLGYKILPQVQVNNQLGCAMVDGTFFAAAQPIQPEDEETADKLAFAYSGPFIMLSPHVKFVEQPRQNNIAQNVLPVMQDLREQVRTNTGSYQAYSGGMGAGDNEGGERKTRLQVQSELTTKVALSTAAINLFYIPWERLLKECFRRVCLDDWVQDEPGAKEVLEFRKRLAKQKVPLECLKHIIEVKARRAVGFGSPQARLLAQDEISAMTPQLDEIGRRNAIRDRIATRVGWAQVDRYAPPLDESVRMPIDYKIAELENSAMMQGSPVSILSQENHKLHLDSHLKALQGLMSAVRSGGMNPQQALSIAQAMFQHCEDHLAEFEKDTTRVPETKVYNKAMNILGGLVSQLQNNVQEMQAKAQAAQAEIQQQAIDFANQNGFQPKVPGQGGGQGGPTPVGAHPPGPEAAAFQSANNEVPLDPLHRQRMQQQLEEHGLKLRMQMQDAAVKNQIRASEAAQKLQIQNASLASAGLKEARAQTPTNVQEDIQAPNEF